MDYFYCPNCGAKVKKKALSCPECGSDAATGWSENAEMSEFEPESEFDYEESLQKEFGEKPKIKMDKIWVGITAIILLVFFILYYLI